MTIERVKIQCAFSAACYGRAEDPDGNSYDYCKGSYVIASVFGCDDHGDYTDQWIYVGRGGDTTGNGGVYCFEGKDHEAFIDRVISKGSINTKYWWHAERNYRNDLPDYVTNWHRPEYN